MRSGCRRRSALGRALSLPVLVVVAASAYAAVMLSVGAGGAAGGPAHFGTLPPRAPLPSGQDCAVEIPSAPETVATNIPFNQTMPTASQLAEFYRHPVFGANPPLRISFVSMATMLARLT